MPWGETNTLGIAGHAMPPLECNIAPRSLYFGSMPYTFKKVEDCVPGVWKRDVANTSCYRASVAIWGREVGHGFVETLPGSPRRPDQVGGRRRSGLQARQGHPLKTIAHLARLGLPTVRLSLTFCACVRTPLV